MTIFFSVFWPLCLPTSTQPNEICMASSHTLARLPRKINFSPIGPPGAEQWAAAWGQLRHFGPLRTTFSTVRPSKSQPIGPVSEICVPDNAKCHHRKFRRDRSTLLGLVRCATDRQTARLIPPRFCPHESRPLEWGGNPPNPPLRRPGETRPSNGGETPPNPPRHYTVASRMAIFATSVPSLRSGTDKIFSGK